jgi:periplasmic protein CpxP/Spy
MRKILCGIALGAFLALTANVVVAQTEDAAQGPPPGRWGHGPMDPAAEAAHMAKRLSLSTEQQSQVQSVLTSQQAAFKALNENQTITHQQWLVQTKALHEQTRTQIDAVLTPAQKQEMAEHMRGPREGRGGPPPPPPPAEQ